MQLGAGTYDMGGASLAMPDSVQLVGISEHASVLRWSQAANTSLVHNDVNCTRFSLEKLRIEVTAAQGSQFVIDIAGHGGTKVRNTTVWMPNSLATSASVVHTHSASGFEVSNCNLTHDNEACKPGYPHASIFFFDAGTETGLVQHNTGFARCTSFVGFSASGVMLEDNIFTELPYGKHSQAGGNGFASFGSPRKSERVSYSRNIYHGYYTGDNSPDGSFPHEAFTSDGTGGAYAGLLTGADANSVTVRDHANAGYIGGAVAILNGKGQGQYRKISSVGSPKPPTPSPPIPPPSPPFNPADWRMLPGHNGSECSATHGSGHLKPLWEGQSAPDACLKKCASNAECRFATVEFFPKTRPGGGYCVLHRTCPAMTGWDNAPCVLPAPACMLPNSTSVVTYGCTSCPPVPPAPPPVPINGQYYLEEPFDVLPDATSYVTVIPFVGNTMCVGNEISNSTTLQIYGSGFNVIFAANTLKQCAHSS